MRVVGRGFRRGLFCFASAEKQNWQRQRGAHEGEREFAIVENGHAEKIANLAKSVTIFACKLS